ncbi:hypothetical protein Gotur_033993, partial [Gossypium turneri]
VLKGKSIHLLAEVYRSGSVVEPVRPPVCRSTGLISLSGLVPQSVPVLTGCLIEECWSEEPFRRPTFRQIITRLDDINNQLAHKGNWKVGPLKCLKNFENMLKRDRLNPSSRTSRSTTR